MSDARGWEKVETPEVVKKTHPDVHKIKENFYRVFLEQYPTAERFTTFPYDVKILNDRGPEAAADIIDTFYKLASVALCLGNQGLNCMTEIDHEMNVYLGIAFSGGVPDYQWRLKPTEEELARLGATESQHKPS